MTLEDPFQTQIPIYIICTHIKKKKDLRANGGFSREMCSICV